MADIRLRRDSVSMTLRRHVAALRNPRPVYEAIGLGLVSLTKRAFKDAALRPAPWPNKKRGGVATLRKTGALWQSIAITRIDNKAVYIGSDRPYAMAHQFGVSSKGIPARPYFPFTPAKRITPTARRYIEAIVQRKLDAMLRKR